MDHVWLRNPPRPSGPDRGPPRTLNELHYDQLMLRLKFVEKIEKELGHKGLAAKGSIEEIMSADFNQEFEVEREHVPGKIASCWEVCYWVRTNYGNRHMEVLLTGELLRFSDDVVKLKEKFAKQDSAFAYSGR